MSLPADHSPLVRRLGLRASLLIVAASMIGTGIFTTSGFILEKVRHPWVMMLAWLCGGLLSLCGALCYGELGAMFPEAGGDYTFLRQSFGKKMAFLSGWISLLVGFSAPAAAAASAFGTYFHALLPQRMQALIHPNLPALCALAAITVVHAKGLHWSGKAQSFLTSFNLGLIFVLILFGFLSPKGNFAALAKPLDPSSFFSTDFFASLILVSFAYSGWNAIAYLGGEIKRPEKNMPRAIVLGTLLVTAVYLLLNFLFIYALSPAQMFGKEQVGSLAAQKLFGDGVGKMFGLGISLTLLSCLSAIILTGPRVYYAMAKDRVFFKLFEAVDSKTRVPVYAIALQSIIAAILIITSTFYTLLIYIGAMLTLFSIFTVGGMIFLRLRQPGLARPYRTWGYPVTPMIFIAVNGWILVSCLRQSPIIVLWGLLTVGSGLFLYGRFDSQRRPRQS